MGLGMKQFILFIQMLLALRVYADPPYFSCWTVDTNTLAAIEPLLKQACWDRSDQRRQLADAEIRVEITENLSNSVIQIPDVRVQDNFTIQGIPFTNYYRSVSGYQEGSFKYIQAWFSPVPITNRETLFGPTIFKEDGRRFSRRSPIPFIIYIDLHSGIIVDESGWYDYRRQQGIY